MARAHRQAAAVSALTPALGGRFHAWRIPFVAAALLAMMYGAWLGLVRLGWNLPVLAYDQLGAHGPLMVCGFLGTLIATERAVALREPWGYLGPLLTAAAPGDPGKAADVKSARVYAARVALEALRSGYATGFAAGLENDARLFGAVTNSPSGQYWVERFLKKDPRQSAMLTLLG